MSTPLAVLIVEDSTDDLGMLVRLLRRAGYDPDFERVENAEDFQAALHRRTWDVVISDYSLPRFSAPAALALLKRSGRDLPFVILSGVVGEADAVAAMKAGAHDYIRKDKPARLIPAIEREIREAGLRRKNRHLEQALRQSEKMDIIGRFADQVAAEFVDVLTTITRATTSLNTCAGPHGQPLEAELQSIQHAVRRGAVLIHDLLALTGKDAPQSRLLDLNTVISEMYPTLRQLVGQQIHLTTRFEDPLARLNADQEQIEQILMNLVVNARDASSPGANITIETANSDIDANYVSQYLSATPGGYVMLSVTDNGSLIEPDARARVFEPFFSARPRVKGGLGLAYVYSIVKKNGGDLRVDSGPEQGTRFAVYFRQVEAPMPAAAQRPLQPPAGAQTILLVDGDETLCLEAQRALGEGGYSVLEARDAGAARLVSREYAGPIHLLITDIVLPDTSGYDLAGELAHSRADLQVLYTSAYDNPGHTLIDRARLILHKPVTAALLLAKVREILTNAQASTVS